MRLLQTTIPRFRKDKLARSKIKELYLDFLLYFVVNFTLGYSLIILFRKLSTIFRILTHRVRKHACSKVENVIYETDVDNIERFLGPRLFHKKSL